MSEIWRDLTEAFPLPGPIGAFLGRLHPLLVHFPIAFLLTATALELGRALRRRPPSPLARGFLLAGAVSAVLAALLGLQLGADPAAPRGGALDLHRWAGIGAAAFAPVAWLLALAARGGEIALVRLARAGLVIAAGLLVVAAHLGASLSHGSDWLTEPFRREAPPEPAGRAPAPGDPPAGADPGASPEGLASAGPAGSASLAPDRPGTDASGGQAADAGGGDAAEVAALVERVEALFEARCERCHGEERAKAGLRLSRLEEVIGPDPSWAVVVPGDPERSELLRRVRLPADHEERMPLDGEPLSPEEVALLERWIRLGAPLEAAGARAAAARPEPAPAGPGPEAPATPEPTAQRPAPPTEPPGAADESDGAARFEEVAAVLAARCIECHGPDKAKGRLRLDTRERAFRVRRGAAAIVPGDPEASEALRRVGLPEDDEDAMPPEGPRLTAAEREALRAWIAAGAPWPEGRVLAAAGPPGEAEPAGVPPGPLPVEVLARLEELRREGIRAAPLAQDSGGLEVSLSALGPRADDARLAALADLAPRIVRLDLSGTAVSDAGLAALAPCTALAHLRLAGTAVGDAGLAHLARLPRLEVLVLVGTAVTDEGLAALAAAPALRRVYVWRTSVTEVGARALLAAHPGIEVIGALGRRLGRDGAPADGESGR